MPLLTPTISCIGCSVLEVGGGGLYRPLSAQVLTDAANVLEQKRFTPTRHPLQLWIYCLKGQSSAYVDGIWPEVRGRMRACHNTGISYFDTIP